MTTSKTAVVVSIKTSIAFSILLAALSVFSYNAAAQVPPSENALDKRISLRDYLVLIVEKHSIDILFEEDLVKGIFVQPSLDISLHDALLSLNTVLHSRNLHLYELREGSFILKPLNKKLSFLADSASQLLVVSGQVTNEKGDALSGVNIFVKNNPGLGAESVEDGSYSLSRIRRGDRLVYRFIGYEPYEIVVTGGGDLDVQLKPDVVNLEELVVVAYGEKTEDEITNAVSHVDEGRIKLVTALSPEQALRGNVTGVYIDHQGVDPNLRPTIRIRGVTTFSAQSNPLYVLDGVILEDYGSSPTFENFSKIQDLRGSQNLMNLVNPFDLESITILKDATSSAAFGSRASNGVILLNTKKGNEGPLKLVASIKTGISNVRKKIDVLSTEEYISVIRTIHQNDPLWLNIESATDDERIRYNLYQPSSATYLGNSPTFDWQSAIINKNAQISDYNLSVSGGTDRARYYMGGNYSYQESALRFNSQDRYSFVLNSNFKLGRILEIGENLRTAYTHVNDNRVINGVPTNLLVVGLSTPPFQPIYDEAGPLGFATTDPVRYANRNPNWLAIHHTTGNMQDLVKLIGSVYAKLRVTPSLELRGTLSGDFNSYERTSHIQKEYSYFSAILPSPNIYGKVLSSNSLRVRRLSADYHLHSGSHAAEFYVHMEAQQSRWKSVESRSGSITDVSDPDQFRLSGTASTFTYMNEKAYLNYVGRISYNFKEKYFVDVVLNRQATSIFAPSNRWGTFPAASFAWHIHKEELMYATGKWLGALRLKAGVGVVGNSDIVPWQYLSLVQNASASYITGGTPRIGSYVQNLANTDLRWERVSTSNIALEIELLSSVTVSAGAYRRYSNRILQQFELPGTAGVRTLPFKNIGAMVNAGIEASFGFRQIFGKVLLDLSGNITTVRNRIVALDNNRPTNIPQVGFVQLGHSFNSLYGYEVAGVIRTTEELLAYQEKYDGDHVNNLSPGDLMYKDVGGPPTSEDVAAGRRFNPQPDGRIDRYDGMSKIGKTIPGYFFGFHTTLSYKGFDLTLLFQGVGDVQRVNLVKMRGLAARYSDYNNKVRDILDAWTPENQNSSIPRINAGPAAEANNNLFSDRWIENGDFVRLSTMEVGYNLPVKLVSKTELISNARVFILASNLFTITKYSGLDPENDQFPAAQTILFGVTIGM
jgi:TonB-dependent starch-binding outer membrane protein SusC